MATPTHSSSSRGLPQPVRSAIHDCPEAFAAVGPDLTVIEWNPAAERLTGFSREQAMGGPLPHMTRLQRHDLQGAVATFDDWAGDVPIIVPRRHADGRMIQVAVSAYSRLVDEDGSTIGYGSWFRSVRSSDPRARVRNVYSRHLSQAIRATDVASAFARALQDLLPGDEAYLLADHGEGWGGVLSAGANQGVAETIRLPEGERATEVAMTGTPDVVTISVAGCDTRALLVPAGHGPVTAVLALAGPGVEDADSEAVELAATVAAEVWAAKARVDALSELEAQVDTLQAIAGLANASDLGFDALVAHVARHAADVLSCERAGVYLWDDDHTELRLEAFHATDRRWPMGHPIHQAGRQSVVEMVSQISAMPIQDTEAHPWLAGAWGWTAGAVSLHAMPLVSGDRDLGLLVAAHTRADPEWFTGRSLHVGAALARQAALALSNAHLLAAQASANKALKEVNRRRADYVEGITHDLRTPITAVLGFAKTLRRTGDRLGAEDRVEALESIERQALRVSRMLDDMMDSARADAGELRPDRQVVVPLHHVVSEALLIATPEQRRRLRATCDPTVDAFGDADQLTRVVQNLIGNALRYAPGTSPVEVRVDRLEGQAQLLVVDHGPGIPAGLDLFGRFSRGDSRGTGLGLYTVKTMVQAHGGTIDLLSTDGGGTTVDVRLPLHRAPGEAGEVRSD